MTGTKITGAMAIDGSPEDYVSSLGLNPREFKQNDDSPSAEDVAWADSCLTVDSLSQSGWGSLRDALLDAFDSQSGSPKHEKHDFCSGTNIEMIKFNKLTENTVVFSDGDDNEMMSSSKETKTSVNLVKVTNNRPTFINDNNLHTEHGDTFGPGFNLKNVFLPTYNESHRNVLFSDPEYESNFQEFVIDDQSPKDIFKIWELGSAVEDEELINELNKALSEKPLEPLPAVSDFSGPSNDLREHDDLISVLSDLSLVEGAV